MLKSAALGVDHIKTLQFIASGAAFTVGQNFAPGDQRLKLDVQTIVPFHGDRIVSMDEVGTQARRIILELA